MVTRRIAFLIGAPTFGLRGPAYDVKRLSATLKERNFQILSLVGADATQVSILRTFDYLASTSNSGDCIVIYYSGHGGIIHLPKGQKVGQDPYIQYLVPWDFEHGPSYQFRGILEAVLSQKIAAITTRTHNVTVILDCCHAARMVRRHELRARALDSSWQSHKRWLDQLQTFSNQPRPCPEGNPYVVRLTAAGTLQSAFEYVDDHQAYGLMTSALCDALSQIEDPSVSWQTVGQYVRERVLYVTDSQRVDIEGPSRRTLFKTCEREASQNITFGYEKGWPPQPRLNAGKVHGVHKGSTYGLFPAQCEHFESETMLATARTTHVSTNYSLLKILSTKGPLKPGLKAFLLNETKPRHVVKVSDEIPNQALATCQTAFTQFSRDIPSQEALASIKKVAKGYQLDTPEQGTLALAADLASLKPTIFRLARAKNLIQFIDHRDGDLSQHILSWGLVHDGQPQRFQGVEESVAPGAYIYFHLKNNSPTPLYLNVLHIDYQSEIGSLNQHEPAGALVTPGHDRYLGYDPQTTTAWYRITRDASRLLTDYVIEHLVCLVSNAPLALNHWEQTNRSSSTNQCNAVYDFVKDLSRQTTWRSNGFTPTIRYRGYHFAYQIHGETSPF